MSPLPRPHLPAAARRVRRAPTVVALVALLTLGGAVAGGYTTGVVLGTRIAPPGDALGPTPPARVQPGAGQPDGPTSDPTTTTTTSAPGPGPAPLPDRATTRPGASSVPVPPAEPDDPAPTPTPPPGPDRPYAAIWPYTGWTEVRDHVRRGEVAFSSPEETALRFAADVAGTTDATVTGVSVDGNRATVDLRAGGGPTRVTLARLVPPGTAVGDAPWGVISAAGDVTVRAPERVTGTSLEVTVTGGAASAVGVTDRRSWRGLVVPGNGAAVVPLLPGSGARAVVVALSGDPRHPSSFAAVGVELAPGAGQPTVPPPDDPVAAAVQLAGASGRGDVVQAWEMLTPAVRSAVRDWRGLAARLPALRERLAPVRAGEPVVAVTVTIGQGPVSVVTPAVIATGVDPLALPFQEVDGQLRLAALEPPSRVEWTAPTAEVPELVVAGPTQPAGVAIDGTVVEGEPAGPDSVRIPVAALPAGDHVAVAVFADGVRIRAAAFGFATSPPPPPPEPATPAGGEPAGAPSGGAGVPVGSGPSGS